MNDEAKIPTGADIHQQRAQKQQYTAEIFADLKLRQWAVEQAVKVANLADHTGNDVNVYAIVLLYNKIFNFIINKENANDKESTVV